jgi:DNA-binding CsgD family transcriptional regulator
MDGGEHMVTGKKRRQLKPAMQDKVSACLMMAGAGLTVKEMSRRMGADPHTIRYYLDIAAEMEGLTREQLFYDSSIQPDSNFAFEPAIPIDLSEYQRHFNAALDTITNALDALQAALV